MEITVVPLEYGDELTDKNKLSFNFELEIKNTVTNEIA